MKKVPTFLGITAFAPNPEDPTLTLPIKVPLTNDLSADASESPLAAQSRLKRTKFSGGLNFLPFLFTFDRTFDIKILLVELPLSLQLPILSARSNSRTFEGIR